MARKYGHRVYALEALEDGRVMLRAPAHVARFAAAMVGKQPGGLRKRPVPPVEPKGLMTGWPGVILTTDQVVWVVGILAKFDIREIGPRRDGR